MAKTLKDFLNERQLGPMVVKNPDEQKFIDKHVVAKTGDRNGNGDEVFKGSKVKMADRKKENHGYNPGEDEEVYEAAVKLTPGWGDGGKSMKANYGKLTGNQHKLDKNKNGKLDADDFKRLRKEEAEELEELSTPTLQSYRKKARAQGNAIVDKMKMGGGDWSKDQKDTKTLRKRSAGAQASGKQLVKRGESLKTEEAEQIDELSNKTLGSYVKKAKDQMSRSDTLAGRAMGAREHGAKPSASERKHNARANKRYFGIDKAVDKMTKEEVELEEAMSSYDRYTSTHGEVTKMLKSIGDHLATHKKAAISHSSPYDKKKGPHWGHVGDIDNIHSRLKDIHDQLAQRGEYAKMSEEVEELDELSHDTLRSYRMKAKSVADHGGEQRTKGRELAGRKSYGGRMTGVEKAKVMAKEEAAQVDEVLTAKTPMGTYIKDFQKSDAPQFKGKSKDKRRVMAIAAKLSAERGGKPLNKEERLLAKLGDITESHQRTMLAVFDKLNEDNQRAFMQACDTAEGIEQMLDFSIQYRGE